MECRLTDDWENTENIIIYGFGKVAHDNLDFFKIILTLSILLMVIRVSVILNTRV